MIKISDVLKYISYIPKTVNDRIDGCTYAEFRTFKKHVPSIELKDDTIYFDILDLSNYKNGEIIPIKSDSRKRVINTKISSEKELVAATRHITSSLHDLYAGELTKKTSK